MIGSPRSLREQKEGASKSTERTIDCRSLICKATNDGDRGSELAPLADGGCRRDLAPLYRR
jgi:hypothetical protein